VIRRTAVAGSWYPDNPTRLAVELDLHLANAAVELTARSPRALIVPHAGLMYSGPVAAFAYKMLSGSTYRSIVLVGPSHFVPFRGVSIWPAGHWQTPFGAVAVDTELAHAIRMECFDVVDLPSAHGREHSLEMQMPFVAHLQPGARIVPLVMGHQTRETAFALGDAIARACRVRDDGFGASRNPTHNGPAPVGRVPLETEATARSTVLRAPRAQSRGESGPADVLLIASSDLSHYETADVASRMDAVMVDHVEALDPKGLMTALEHEPRHACGGGPMVAVMHAARQLGASEAQVLRYADSGDVSGDKSSVVGYLAAAVF
jgi:predicted class III extradiol MEMO1 family dioxygenase